MSLYPLIDGNIWESVRKDHGQSPGVYFLRLRDEALSGFTAISRLLATDTRGILYIGTSAKIPNRVGALKKAVCAAYGGIEGYSDRKVHGVGRMISDRFVRAFGSSRLWVEVQPYENPAGQPYNHYEEELHQLESYAAIHGEFPPLNGPKPRRSAAL